MTPITFVTFKWKPSVPDYRSTFLPEHVHTLKAMIERHYPEPHRFVCVTDDATGLAGLESLPLWTDHATLTSPAGRHNPCCYRRLKLFAPDAGAVFGERLVCMDLDTVITGDLRPLFAGGEDFKIWGESDYPGAQWYNGSLWMLRTGSRPQVWTHFNPRVSPYEAHRVGKRGSDQAWFAYILGKREATWGRTDGVYSFRKHIKPTAGGALPADARIVNFHGHVDPWSYEAQRYPWIQQHYRRTEVAA